MEPREEPRTTSSATAATAQAAIAIQAAVDEETSTPAQILELHGYRSSTVMKQVLVLNASYEALNVTSVRRAHVLVFKGKAEVVEALERPLRSATDTYPWPHVIRLVTYVSVPRTVQRKISRRALFARDGWRCGYCGTSTGRLTLDHIVPRSRGGDSVWENVVTSCARAT